MLKDSHGIGDISSASSMSRPASVPLNLHFRGLRHSFGARTDAPGSRKFETGKSNNRVLAG
jgi:hypothetical protein